MALRSSNIWQEPLPDGIHLDEPVRLCVQADLRPDGCFGKEWLAVSETRMWVVVEGGTESRVRLDLLLSELSEPKAKTLVGGARWRYLGTGLHWNWCATPQHEPLGLPPWHSC